MKSNLFIGHEDVRPLAPIETIVAMALIIPLFSGNPALASADAAANPGKEYTLLQQRSDRLIVSLPNRMIVIAQAVRTAPVVSAQIWTRAGSIHEAEFAGAGISHHLEHLLSGGSTTTRTETESNALLSRMGAQVNAATSLDTVRYYINTTSDNRAQAVALLSDWLMNNTVSQKEFDREHGVIPNEFAMGRAQPGRILWKLTQRAHFRHHPARHPTIGYLEQFSHLTRDDLHTFYRRMYVPNNMVFVVVGDIDKQAVVDQIAKLWSDIPAADVPEILLPVEAPPAEARQVVGYAQVSRPRIRLLWHGTKLGAEHDYALDVLAGILGQVESSRLVQTVRNEHRAVNTIYASNYSTAWSDGFFAIDAEVAATLPGSESAPDQQLIERAVKLIREQVQRVIEKGVTDAELAMARRQTQAYYVNAAQTAQGLAGQLAGNMIARHDPDYMHHYLDALDKLTPRDVRRAAAAVLGERPMTTVKLLPLEEGETPTDFVYEEQPIPAGVRRAPVEVDNQPAISAMQKRGGEADDVPAATLGDVKLFTLPNGLRLLVQRNTLTPSVSLEFYQFGGLLADEPGKEGLAHAAAMMQMRGTSKHSARELANAIEQLGAVMRTNSGNNTSYAQATCLSQDWPTVLGLLAEVVMEPSFPEDQWQLMQPRLLAAIRRQDDSVFSELRGRFRERYYGEHPWSQHINGRLEAVASFTVTDLRQFHADRLGAEQSVIAVIGDVDPEAVRDAVAAAFAKLPRAAEAQALARTRKPAEAGVTQFRTGKPDSAAVTVGFGPLPTRDHDDMPALQVLAAVLHRFPSGRLVEALRGTGDGLAYAVWASPFMGLAPGHFEMGFNATGENAIEALTRTMQVQRSLMDKPVTDDELAAAKAAVLMREYLGQQSNSQRATSIALDELYGLGHDNSDRLIKQVGTLTAEQLQAVAKKYLKDPVVVIVSDKEIEAEALERAIEIPAK